MPIYKENSREFRLLSEILSTLTVEFGEKAPVETVKGFIKDSDFRVRPIGVINDLNDNKLAKIVDDTIYFNNYEGGEKENLSKEMKTVLEIILKVKEISRDEFLVALAEKGYSRKGRSILQEARKKELIRGFVKDKVPTYSLIED